MNNSKEYWGLLQRREFLVPTWQGLLLFMLIGAGLITIAVLNIHSFLAVTKTVPAEILVVEGWTPAYVMEATMIEFQRGHYRKLYVTGGPIGTGEILSEYKTWADFGVATLLKMGMQNTALEAVPSSFVKKDRTYISALALKTFLQQQKLESTNINLVSFGVHSRRSHLLFQQVFGNSALVGIIAVKDRSYDPEHWWKFSAGFRSVVDEFIAYIYAVAFF